MNRNLNLYIYSTFFLALSIHAETQVIGAAYAVAEPDALEEIRKTAGTIPWETHLSPTLSSAADRSVLLPEATEEATRVFTPDYITPFDVTDKDGNILYRKGFRYNVLEHVRLPMRIVVFRNRQSHLEWVRTNRKASDILLLSGPGLNAVINELEPPVYLLSNRISERLGLEKIPCIAEQEHHHFLIREFNLERSVD